jgi:PKD repeat protein
VVRLTVTDNRGKTATTTTTVVAGTSNQRPIAVMTALPTSGPAPLLVQLGSTGSSDPDGSIVSYAWNFGNGETATGTATQFNYTTPGTYTVTLTVTDNRGASTATTETIVVDPPAAASDRFKVQFSGGLTYGFDGKVATGNLRVTRDAFGIASVTGSGTYAGPGGSSGTISVSLTRFLFFNAFSGTVRVSDPTNGVNNVATQLLLQPLSSPSSTSARGSGTGSLTNPTRSYAVSFTIDDRV